MTLTDELRALSSTMEDRRGAATCLAAARRIDSLEVDKAVATDEIACLLAVEDALRLKEKCQREMREQAEARVKLAEEVCFAVLTENDCESGCPCPVKDALEKWRVAAGIQEPS